MRGMHNRPSDRGPLGPCERSVKYKPHWRPPSSAYPECGKKMLSMHEWTREGDGETRWTV